MSRQGRGKSRAHSRRGNRYDGSQVHIKRRRENEAPRQVHAERPAHEVTQGGRLVWACLLPLLLAWGMQHLHLMPLDKPAHGYWGQWWQGALVLIGSVVGVTALLLTRWVLGMMAARSSR